MKFKIEGSEFTIEELLHHIGKGNSGHFKAVISGYVESANKRIAELEAEAEREDGITIDALDSMREWRLRAEAAEAEIARRDAATGKPDYYIHRVEVCDSYGPDVELRAFNNALDASKCKDDHGGEVVELFAYPPAPSAPDGWIKCSDRMPNDDTLYLGCDFDGVMWTLHFDEGQLMPDIGNLTSEITHWMELPLAPKVR